MPTDLDLISMSYFRLIVQSRAPLAITMISVFYPSLEFCSRCQQMPREDHSTQRYQCPILEIL